MEFDFLNPDSYKNAYEDVKDSAGNQDFLGQLHDTAGGFVDKMSEIFPGFALFREMWNEGSGHNKKREKEYQDKKVNDEEQARLDMREKEIKRMGLLDEMASLAALSRGTGGGSSRTKTLYAAEEETKGDLLGL